jgi:hypothetical protein
MKLGLPAKRVTKNIKIKFSITKQFKIQKL